MSTGKSLFALLTCIVLSLSIPVHCIFLQAPQNQTIPLVPSSYVQKWSSWSSPAPSSQQAVSFPTAPWSISGPPPLAASTVPPIPDQSDPAAYINGEYSTITPSAALPKTSPVVAQDCQPYQCNIFFQYVTVYYWPTGQLNTACLAAQTNIPVSTYPPGLNPASPSVYVVFPSISANDGCKQIGSTYSAITASFAPGELSTIVSGGGATKVFDFADLPCPPPSIEVPEGEAYAPLIAPPDFLFNLDPAFHNCIPGALQGVDPPVACSPANGITGPEFQGDGGWGPPGDGHYHWRRRGP